MNVKFMKQTKNKYGVQIAINSVKDCTWSVSQLVQKTPRGPYTRKTPKGIRFIDYTKPTATKTLVATIDDGLLGKIVGVKYI